MLKASRERTFVAHPVVEGDAVFEATCGAQDVLELLRDYFPRTVFRIADALGMELSETVLAVDLLIALGAVVDGDPAPVSRDRSLAWQRTCSSVLISCSGLTPTDPADLVGRETGIDSAAKAHAVVGYLSVRGLLSNGQYEGGDVPPPSDATPSPRP